MNHFLGVLAVSLILVAGIVSVTLVHSVEAKDTKVLSCNVPNSCKGLQFKGKNMDVEVEIAVSTPPSGQPVTNNTEINNKITSLENDIKGLQSTVESQQEQLDTARATIANLSDTNVLTDVNILPQLENVTTPEPAPEPQPEGPQITTPDNNSTNNNG